jgi:hypothetical protein
MPSCNSDRVQKYDASNLVKGGSVTVSEWRPDRLTGGSYLCPKCKTYNLRFSADNTMLFD